MESFITLVTGVNVKTFFSMTMTPNKLGRFGWQASLGWSNI
jgi:hypothetical protein